MKVSYFPGCTLKTKAKVLDEYARKCAEVLGVTLEEIDNWQCCGGVFTTANDEIATKLSSVRALKHANDKGQPLVSVCSACHIRPSFASKDGRSQVRSTNNRHATHIVIINQLCGG